MLGDVHDDVEITVAALAGRATTREFDLCTVFNSRRNARCSSVGIYLGAEERIAKRDCRFGL